MKIHKVLLIFLLVVISSTSMQLSIIFHINLLKYISVLTYLFVLVLSIYQIIKGSKTINWPRAWIIFLILYLYPIISILLDILTMFSFKIFTDGLMIKGGYYHLMIIALALVTYTNKINFHKILYNFTILTYPIALFLVFLSLKVSSDFAFVIAYLSIDNILIPSSLLVFFYTEKKGFILGWISIFIILILSSYLGSRSYTLVGFYLVVASLIMIYKSNKKLAYKLLTLSLVTYYLGGLSFLSTTSQLRNESILERYQLESLFSALKTFIIDFDFMKLFLWEGNSRAGILIDAFKNFDTIDWLFGKGIFATYTSFVERHTIELLWAQETFRWGLIYVIFIIVLYIKAYLILKKNSDIYFFKVLSILLLIKLLDGFIYGMPNLSLYNLMVFWSIMLIAHKNFNNRQYK